MANYETTVQSTLQHPVRKGHAGPLQGAWWKIGTGLLICYVIYGAFFIAQGANGFGKNGDPARIVFFHVPVAFLSYVCYAVATGYSIKYLTGTGEMDADTKAGASMELGFLFCILATVTGSIFAGVQWGKFWNWDPRETSIVIMLLLYASYLVLRGALSEQPDKRARLAAVYSVIALVPATFLIWVVPRILATMHPTDVIANPKQTSATYKAVLYPAFIGFGMLYVWLLDLRFRLHKLQERRQQRLMEEDSRPVA